MPAKTKKFIIKKIHSTYLVTITGMEVDVEPLQFPTSFSATKTIASSLQIIGNTKLVLHHPSDPFQYLKEFYKSKGWEIEDVE